MQHRIQTTELLLKHLDNCGKSRCKSCNTEFASKDLLDRHQKNTSKCSRKRVTTIEHPNRKRKCIDYRCKYGDCTERFNSKKRLIEHHVHII